MRKFQKLTIEQKRNFSSELQQCPHCGLMFRARGLHSHIFLVHVAAPAIERHKAQQQNQAA